MRLHAPFLKILKKLAQACPPPPPLPRAGRQLDLLGKGQDGAGELVTNNFFVFAWDAKDWDNGHGDGKTCPYPDAKNPTGNPSTESEKHLNRLQKKYGLRGGLQSKKRPQVGPRQPATRQSARASLYFPTRP